MVSEADSTRWDLADLGGLSSSTKAHCAVLMQSGLEVLLFPEICLSKKFGGHHFCGGFVVEGSLLNVLVLEVSFLEYAHFVTTIQNGGLSQTVDFCGQTDVDIAFGF